MTLFEEIGYGLDALVVFRSLKEDPALAALNRLCHCNSYDTAGRIEAYSDMVAALYKKTDNWTDYVTDLVLTSDNLYARRYGAGEPISDSLSASLHRELKLFNRIAWLTPSQLQSQMQAQVPMQVQLASWVTHPVDLNTQYSRRISSITRYGYGIYAQYHMFTLDEYGEITPVENPDPVTLSQLIGYQRERQVIIDNTLTLLRGKYASNVLLSGDAGTGKSATVKAIANTYRSEGLRLIELDRSELHYLPKIMNELCRNPLKFILFIDDLSLNEDDPDLGSLKAVLEGSTTARVKNVVIYATSNRRHLMKETFDDGTDKHINDTVQEQISLSARFGINVTFTQPDKQLYLEIAHGLARQAGIQLPDEELDREAEKFALAKPGRSARTARQFVDQLLASQDKS